MNVSVAKAAAVLAVVFGAEVVLIAPRVSSVALVAAGVWMVLPGIFLVRRALPIGGFSVIAAWVFGPALGLGLSVFGAFLLWAGGLQNWLALLGGPALTWAIAWAIRPGGAPSLRLPAFDRRDVAALACAVLLVPLITWAPYDHIREPVADGEAYRAYFTADFIWAMTVTSELAKGEVPPANPYLRDRPLHYYWMAHFLSGSLYRNVASWGVTAEQVILINGLLFGASFLAFGYGLARVTGAGPIASLVAVAVAMLANSYEGADMIRALTQHGQSWNELKDINIDAVTRWFYKGMAVDGLQRLLLYQPHHLTGYMLALAALWLVGLARDVTETAVPLCAGILLALALLFSTFTAMIVGGAVAALYVVRLIEQRAIRSSLQCAVLGAAPVAVGVGLCTALGYTDSRYGFLLQLGLNPVAVRNAGLVWFLSFGPLLIAGALALVRWRWLLREGAAPAALVLVATAFYFFTNVPDSGDVWVGWRSGHLLLIAFATLGGALLQHAWHATRWRGALTLLVLLAVVPAVPTVAIDVYNAQDINNRNQGAGFPWTLVITPAEREALDWVRQATPARAVVQFEPVIRGAASWSLIPAFAERRMIAGLPISMTPLRPYSEASDQVLWSVFRAASAADAHAMAQFLGIDYLWVGTLERRAYTATVSRITAATDLFPIVFKNDVVTIYQVTPAAPAPPRRPAPAR
ncbi:MAG TPA: hypothetical protein VNJ02_11810 [Vicinamibacterales bacterium]|nr:hypothetical protein [Vicinamibacterales bacterium]